MNCPRRHMCWQSKRFYWERAPGESSRVREPRRTALPHGLPHGLGITVMGLVSWLSLANHSDSESFLVVNALFSQDGCQREGFWGVVGPVVSPFDLSWTLLIGGGLLVVFLTRTSCHKTTHANGYYGAWPGWAVSIGVHPLTIIYMFQCYSLNSSHPGLLPQSPKVCSLHQCLFCCLAYRVII